MTSATGQMARPPGLRRRLMAPFGVLGVLAAGATLVAFVDPHEGHYPTCPFLLMTGYYCPGCGGLRMVNSLTHGDVPAAFGMNPLLFALLPVFGYLWVRWVVLTTRGERMGSGLFRPGVVYAFMGVVLVFWVTRNLPFGQALAP